MYESQPAEGWNRFSTRAVDEAVQRAFARSTQTLAAFTEDAATRINSILGANGKRFAEAERRALRDLAPVLSLVPDLERWNEEELRGLSNIIRAKAGGDENTYVQLTAGHARFRRALLRLGSSRRSK